MRKDHQIEISFEIMKAEDLPKKEKTVDTIQKNRIVEACFEAKEMIEFYKTQEINDDILCNLLSSSALSIEKKLELFKPIKDHRAFTEMYEETLAAAKALTLKKGEFFMLSTYNYWDKINYKSLLFQNAFYSNEALNEYIKNDCECDTNSDAMDYWYTLEKWAPCDDGTYELCYVYQLINGVPVYFEKHKNGFYRNSVSPSMSIPFSKGDVVAIDCRPFVSLKYAVLLEDGYHSDGRNKCFIKVLLQKADGTWIDGLLWGNAAFSPNILPLSPLYRIRKYDDDLGENNSFITAVTDFAKNEKNGKNLWHKLVKPHLGKLYYPGYSKEKVLQFIDEIKDEIDE